MCRELSVAPSPAPLDSAAGLRWLDANDSFTRDDVPRRLQRDPIQAVDEDDHWAVRMAHTALPFSGLWSLLIYSCPTKNVQEFMC